MFSWILPQLLLLSTLPYAHCLTCYSPAHGTILPIIAHCRDLANAIIYAGNLPEYRNARSWGRRLEDSPTSIKIPKLYWLPGRGPDSCAMTIDVLPQYPLAVETFRLVDVGIATAAILNVCLIGRQRMGMELMGATKFVSARLVRSDAPRFLEGDVGESIDLGSGRGELWFADVTSLNATILRSIGSGLGGDFSKT